TLLNNDISLLAYHLPLDLHPEVGNNVQLGRQLGFEIEGPLEPGNPRSIVLVGSLAEPMLPSDLALHVRDVLGREPLLVDGGQP
ncbi:Nif3-like dinuclear metal center hexameric protein, partial [Pseudomonas sp. BAgro211]|nr:Nif3-like dinuclear metal center hexameric protein [Pseudomonas sp. BAgro211]